MPVSYGNRFQLKNYDNYYTKPIKPLPQVRPVTYSGYQRATSYANQTGSPVWFKQQQQAQLERNLSVYNPVPGARVPPVSYKGARVYANYGYPQTANANAIPAASVQQPTQVITNNGLIGNRYQKGNKFWLKNADEAPGANPVIQEYLPAPATTDTSGGGYGYSSYGGGGYGGGSYGGGSRGYSGSNYVNQWLNGLIKWNI